MHYVINAENKSLGRVASEAAIILRGKNNPDFKPNKVADVQLVIENASRIKLTGNKLKNKEYIRYSGYPGGQKRETMEKVIEKKGIEFVVRKAVEGMLPKNRLRKRMMRNIIIKE